MHGHKKLQEFKGYHFKKILLWEVTKVNLAKYDVRTQSLK